MNTRNPETPVKFWRRRIVVLFGAALVLFLAAALSAALWFAVPLLVGPRLTELTVSGRLQHVDPAAVRAAVAPVVGRGFFDTRVDTVSTAVKQIPWVAEADVRREWPHTLRVDIVEEVPVAHWNGGGLVDAQGRVFVKDQTGDYKDLPQLSGKDADAEDVLSEYDTLTNLVTPRGLSIVALDVDARGAATVELSDGIEVRLGREDASGRLARFTALALPALGARLATVAYVDMRYTNGFAVGWKTAGEHVKQGA